MASDVIPTYTRMPGPATTLDPMYEFNLLGLLYLRCLKSGLIDQFQLATKAKGAGALDDIVLRYTTCENPLWQTCYIQLKHKKGKFFLEALKAEKRDFSMDKYRESIVTFKKEMSESDKSVLLSGAFNNCCFIIYVDAEVDVVSDDNELKKLLLPGDCENDFVFQIDDLRGSNVVGMTKESVVKDLFGNFLFFSGQPSENESTTHTEKTLLECTGMTTDNALLLSSKFERQLKFYCNLEGICYVLSDKSDLLKSVLDEFDFEKSLLHEKERLILNVAFQENVEVCDAEKLKNTSVLHLVALGKSVKMTSSKLFNFLNKEGKITAFFGLSLLLQNSYRLLSYWVESRYDVLVIVCETNAQFPDNVHEKFSEVLYRNPDKRFIIVSLETNTNASSFYSNLAAKCEVNPLCTVHDSFKVSQLSPDTLSRIRSKILTFQGHKVTLTDFLQKNLEFTETFTDDFVECLLSSEDISFGPSFTNLIEYYISRSLQRYNVLSNDLLWNLDVAGKFAVSGVTVEELTVWIGNEEVVGGALELRDRYKYFVLDANLEEEEYEQLCSTFGDVHWVHMIDNQLMFVQTYGRLDVIRPKIKNDCFMRFSPENALDLKVRVVLLLAEPGMGKSTMLSYLEHETKRAFPTFWVIRIDLKDHVDLLNGEITKDAVEYLLLASGIKKESELEQALFKCSLEVLGNVIVLLDGFDEISPKYEENACNLLENMLTTKVKCIWVTSRKFTKNKLEKCTSSISFNLRPFTDDDQREFFHSFWKSKEKWNEMTDELKNNFITNVQSLVTHSINDYENDLLGIPMQTMLVAEYFEQYLTEPKKEKWPKKPSLLELFESIIERKFLVYTRKINLPENIDGILKMSYNALIVNHMYIALILLIDNDDLEKVHNYNEIISRANAFLQIVESGAQKFGIVDGVENGEPVFIHRTLAEYFVALWYSKNFESNKTFLSEHLFQPYFKVIRYFFDRLLAKNRDLHNSVLDENQLAIENPLSESETIINSTDNAGRTLLHLASAYHFDLIVKNVYDENKLIEPRPRHMIELLMEYKPHVNVVDTLFGWTPVQYAFHLKNWEAVGILMENNVSTENLRFSMGIHIYKILHFVIMRGFVNFMEFLLKQVSVNHELRSNEQGMSESFDFSLIHRAVRCGQTRIVKLLISREVDVMAYCNSTLLHCACVGGHSATANVLLESLGDDHEKVALFVNETLDFGKSALDFASSSEVVTCLLSYGADIWKQSSALFYSRNALHRACLNGNTVLVQALVDSLRDKPDDMSLYIRTTDNIGNSPLHLSCKGEIIQFLIKVGGNIWARNDEGHTPLQKACENENLPVVEALLESFHGDHEAIVSYINHPDYEGRTALHVAQSAIVIRCLVESGGDVWSRDRQGATPLHLASNKNGVLSATIAFIDCVRDKENKVQYMNATDVEGRTALHTANVASTVRCLVAAGGDIWSRDNKGATPLHVLSLMGRLHSVNEVLECVPSKAKKVQYVKMKDEEGRTALHMARNEDVVRSLVRAGGDVWSKDNKGATPLHVLSEKDLNGSVRALIKCVKKKKRAVKYVNMTDVEGRTALHMARTWSAVKCLVNSGGDVWSRDGKGATPMHALSMHGCLYGVKALIECVSDEAKKVEYVNMKDEEGRTAFDYAASNDDPVTKKESTELAEWIKNFSSRSNV